MNTTTKTSDKYVTEYSPDRRGDEKGWILIDTEADESNAVVASHMTESVARQVAAALNVQALEQSQPWPGL